MIAIYFASLWKIFEKAGRTKKWEGFVPGYNIIIWLKILEKPWWWIFFFPIPFVNLVIAIALNVETARKFGKYDPKDTVLSILLPWYYIPFLAFKDENQVAPAPTDWNNPKDRAKRTWHDHITLFAMAPFVGHVVLLLFKLIGTKQRPGKGSMEYEWTNAIGFAIVAATIIRTFSFEAFTIPTGSMEKTMRIGDYLFVNKLKYGARSPMTVISVPFVHNRIPGTFMKSYVEWLKMDYFRLPGYGDYTRGDIMVFNWPVGDSVLLHNDIIAHDYYAFVRSQSYNRYISAGGKGIEGFELKSSEYISNTRDFLVKGGGTSIMDTMGNIYGQIESTGGIQTLTLDKKENYVKRCVAVGGDLLEIKDGIIYINNQKQELPPEAQFQYRFYFKDWNARFSAEFLDEKYGIYQQDIGGTQVYGQYVNTEPQLQFYNLTCTPDVYAQLKNHPAVDTSFIMIEPRKETSISSKYSEFVSYCDIFPNHPDFDWSRDNFGPLVIPAEGMTIDLTEENWIFYGRTIDVYENNDVEVKKDGIYINGKKQEKYTFKQNYYWMMGDNRHGSVDSRYWGFVGEDHIVGTASFVWMSKHPEKGWFSGGLRWDRVFSFVK